ncbi:MAG: hypothetical protein JO168_18080 [Solirubrobacterales bacterium]|nr:hypothetical protein [Solirubrobacterales bacterium]MBV9714256.1 hypothetical protein [Solirubrobacterales bacterium]
MYEHYEIIGEARGEPRPAGCVGVRVRVRLSGHPSRRWAHAFGARLATELSGHAAVGHLRINTAEIVQGDEIVLDGVEPSEAPGLAQPLRLAVSSANEAATREPEPARNATQREADVIAGQISLTES